MDSSQHPLEAMVADIAQPKPHHSPEADSAIESKPERPSSIEITDHYSNLPATVSLSGIDQPALLLNANLKVAWQNQKAIDQIWHHAGPANNGTPQPGIFDLIFDPLFKRHVANYTKNLEFIVCHILSMLTKDELRSRIEKMDEERQNAILSKLEQLNPADAMPPMSSSYIQQRLRNGAVQSFEVVATQFNEGRLLVFSLLPQDPRWGDIGPAQSTQQRFERIRQNPNPIKIPHVIMAARLEKAFVLRTEMLSDEYWRLIQNMFRRCIKTIEAHDGIFGKHADSGFCAYFLPGSDFEANPLRAIACGLDIRAMMVEFSREWKIRKDWLHDIELNIGLHWEEDFVGTLPATTGETITSFGPGLNIVTAISQLAVNGQIWTTKALINEIPTASHPRLRFGIQQPGSRRHEAFVRNAFALLKDVFDAGGARLPAEETLDHLPVTQVFDLNGLNP